MKIIHPYLLLLLLLSSCKDFLDVQPSEFLTEDEYYTTLEDLQTALTGAYSAFEDDALGGAALSIVPDITTENAIYQLFFSAYIEISNNEISTSNGVITNCWLAAYRSLNQLNLLLESLEQIKSAPAQQAEREQIRGEALFLRGVIYFELVRLFGKPYGPSSATDLGVPILERATSALSQVAFPARATVEEIYNQAVADLTEAAGLLPDVTQRGRGNRLAATGYLAEIAFQQRNYEQSAELAGAVLEGPYALVPEPELFFTNEGSAEEIFSVIHGTQGNTRSFLAKNTYPDFGPELRLRTDLIDNAFPRIVTEPQRAALANAGLQAIDLRFTTLTILLPDSTNYGTGKYEDFNGEGDDAPLLRLAEFYLMRAEALVRTQGINQESLDLLNAVRTRALRVVDASGNLEPGGEAYIRFTAEDFDTADALIEAIILERRVELVMEGNRFHDLMRLQRDVKGIPYDADRLRWPIPQREIDANGNLVQNPGY